MQHSLRFVSLALLFVPSLDRLRKLCFPLQHVDWSKCVLEQGQASAVLDEFNLRLILTQAVIEDLNVSLFLA